MQTIQTHPQVLKTNRLLREVNFRSPKEHVIETHRPTAILSNPQLWITAEKGTAHRPSAPSGEPPTGRAGPSARRRPTRIQDGKLTSSLSSSPQEVQLRGPRPSGPSSQSWSRCCCTYKPPATAAAAPPADQKTPGKCSSFGPSALARARRRTHANYNSQRIPEDTR